MIFIIYLIGAVIILSGLMILNWVLRLPKEVWHKK